MPSDQGGAPHFSGTRLDVATGNIGTLNVGVLAPSGGVGTPITLGSGDTVPYYVDGTPWLEDFRQGTAASPIILGSGPTLKINRTESIPAATMPAGNGQNNQGNAGLWVAATGDANNQVQVSALLGTSITASTQTRVGATVDPDACAVQGLASVQGSGVGTAIGAYFQGRRDTNTGKANGIEGRSWNQTATAGVYNASGFSDTIAFWASASGTANSAVAFSTGGFASQAFVVGLGFTAGSVLTTTIRDDTSSTNSIVINGTHTVGMALAAGAGPVLIGGTSALFASNLLEVQAPQSTADPLALFGSGSGTNPYSIRLLNGVGSLALFVSGGAGQFLTSSAAGDVGVRSITANKRLLLGGTNIVLSVTNANTLGFFNTAEIAQYATTGTATGFTAGAGTTVTHLSTFTGNTGASAYTIADVVRAMKLYGLMAG